jgi:hypothetical protein
MESMVADDVARQLFKLHGAGELIISCAWCRRVELDGNWRIAPRAALAAIDEFAFSHGVCPACSGALFPDEA